jgi:hypothetical protein
MSIPQLNGPDLSFEWIFSTPPHSYPFPEDITGPINMQFIAFFDNHHVPESGTTALMFGGALILLLLSGITKSRRDVGRSGVSNKRVVVGNGKMFSAPYAADKASHCVQRSSYGLGAGSIPICDS